MGLYFSIIFIVAKILFIESVKKGKCVTKIFFSDNVEWSSKNLRKMMSSDVKANIKQ